MTEKRPENRPGYEAVRQWTRTQKNNTASSFAPQVPHTPPTQRSLSTFSSPGSILGKEEDAVIIELTSRYLCAGLDGESGPLCRIAFGPEARRRVGDYRSWLPGYRRRTESLESWGEGYELWRNDVRNLDLGLVSDVLERAVREVYNKHLLVDAGAGRLILVLPSLVPHPVLETLLSTLFERWRYNTISLFPSPTMSIISAGIRSGLVVDIGWEETVIISVYEYREISSHRTTRAMKLLTTNYGAVLQKKRAAISTTDMLRFDLDFVEEILTRALATIDVASNQETQHTTTNALNMPQLIGDPEFEIQWPGASALHVAKISKHDVVAVLLKTYIDEQSEFPSDDHEISLPNLLYESLLSLPQDIRAECMSRIILQGDGAASIFLRKRILGGLNEIIFSNGWTRVKSRNSKAKLGLNKEAQTGSQPTGAEDDIQSLPNTSTVSENPQAPSRPADAKHNIDTLTVGNHIEDRILKQKNKTSPQAHIQGIIREVHSLGSWAGASLVASLKVRGFVEIERERFLSHGLSGATRDADISVVSQPRVNSFALPTTNKAVDRASWTLGVWG